MLIHLIAVPPPPPAARLPLPEPPPPAPVTYTKAFVTPVGLVYVPLEVKTCTEVNVGSPNPVAVPLLAIVAPDGTVNVSPESPSVKLVPDAGEILSTFSSLVLFYLI